MELIFVRHGETEFNKHKQVMGQRVDAPLDENGLIQAQEVLSKLSNDFTVIYSSPLIRAKQTAEIIAKHFHKPIEYSKQLLERDFGTLSGKTWHEIDELTGEPFTERDNNLEYDYSKYGGETVDQVKARLLSFIEELKSKYSNEVVLVVTHYGIISIMDSLYPHKEHHKLSNASIHRFELT